MKNVVCNLGERHFFLKTVFAVLAIGGFAKKYEPEKIYCIKT